MNRQEAENPSLLLSQHLSSDAQQFTIPAYYKMLTLLNISLKLLSVNRTSDNQPQLFNNIELDNRDNISDSEAITQPLTDDELKNRRYWYEAQQVETSSKI
ncbi:hypothetical protein AJ78_08764 [Emergomyces pasteurianus Ep9510]|uniref:Uncharacterized protein n=1 Tax=Emergomyces pasteurianus Ep9510 TaxID=1447872 RepID=A0A1J9Q2B7_9EURO|nr:hypothetical protein AJ78_08764 [Emergomyces pasteurianus Ep9510]